MNEPMVTIYSDRIEILSRGTIPQGQTVEGFFLGESIPVNKKLSEIFLQLHISEKTGRGVPKITEKYGKEAFELRENSIIVKIPFNWINIMYDKEGNKEAGYSDLNETEKIILKEIKSNPNITKREIQEKIGKGKTAVDRGISNLKEKGYIEHIGSNRKGYWKILI